MNRMLKPLAAGLLLLGVAAAPVHHERREENSGETADVAVKVVAALVQSGLPQALLHQAAISVHAVAPAHHDSRELKTVVSSVELVKAFSAPGPRCIPPTLLHSCAGVAIIPHVVKAGLVVDHRSGHGILLVHEPGGRWSNPVFITIEGRGLGLEAGIESTDLVLVFKTPAGVERILNGKGNFKLGSDAAIAAGPLGRETEVVRPGRRKTEVYSYSRTRGLFAGLSLEGDRVTLDGKANEGFYHVRGCRPADALGCKALPHPVVEELRGHLTRISPPPAPTVVIPARR